MHKNHHEHKHPQQDQHKPNAADTAAAGATGAAPEATEAADAAAGKQTATGKAAAEAYANARKQSAGVDATVGDQPQPEAAPEAKTNEPDYKAIAVKTAAEFDNFRKRVAKEKVLWKREALADFLKEFLPAFDDLTRALKESEKNQSFEVLRDGVSLVRSNLWKVMDKAGVKEIEAHEQTFDPRFHEALTMLPVPGKDAGVVVEVFQPGYLLEDQVLRPSKVVVSAEPPQA